MHHDNEFERDTEDANCFFDIEDQMRDDERRNRRETGTDSSGDGDSWGFVIIVLTIIAVISKYFFETHI